MNKLDEIEARVKVARLYLNSGVTPQSTLAAYVEDVPLLVRAVQQLRAVYSFDGWRSLAEIGRLDPDVLELITACEKAQVDES